MIIIYTIVSPTVKLRHQACLLAAILNIKDQLKCLNFNKRRLDKYIRISLGGEVTEAQLNLYRDLARGEIGLIISHGIFPSPEGQAGAGQLGAHSDAMIPSLKKLTGAVHENGGQIVAQILHGGWFCRSQQTGRPPVGPSSIINPFNGVQVKGLSSEEVYTTIENFMQAGRRLIEAGFDGVQLHAAHSWLISCFLSSATNFRNDEWGGTAEKRANFVRQIYEGIRRIAGKDYPILIKIGLKDYHPQGKSLNEGISSCQMLEAIGIDAIEVSEGLEVQRGHHIRLDALSPYYLEECLEARKALKLPLILVGGMRKLADMEQVVKGGIADAVSMCRPFIMDPYLVKKFREGIIDSSGCTSCNGCSGMARRTLQCKLNS
jgi:2,4-dienoyl-CoA reductase-like NADH-dependent reductase (Old Yellow Enzyme family)